MALLLLLGGKKKRRKHKVKVKRSKKKLKYHGREGYPLIHSTKQGKKYIMVRKKGGGVKRLYLVKGNVPKSQRERR